MKTIAEWIREILREAIAEAMPAPTETEVETFEPEPCRLHHREPPIVTGAAATDYVFLPVPKPGWRWALVSTTDLGTSPRDFFVRNSTVVEVRFELVPTEEVGP